MRRARGGVGRRAFLGGAAAATVGTRVLAAEAVGGAPQAAPPPFLLDAHNHCGGSEEWVRGMVEAYSRRGAMACVITWPRDLELMSEAIASHPEIFVGYGRVQPDDPAAVRHIETFHERGFAGVKFHSPQANWDDPRYFQMYRLCEEFGMVMLFHTGISSRREFDTPTWGSSARMRPMYLDTICRQFPRAIVQGAHLGNPWYEEAAEAARWNPNLFFDVTGSTLPKLIKLGRLERLSEVLWWSAGESEENPHTLEGGPGAWEHIVFGTDEGPSGLEGNIERFQQMLDANAVPARARERMWGLTMAEVLGIDPVTRRRTATGTARPR